MTENRWIANKFGLVNFWYYDYQEYKLADGKVIFRGSNGSGKSVTTQSFIPLLLDGDKRPNRIDPFGTSSRRLENYLLMDEKEEDRTAYLYLEFKKGESYLTLGMGLRARKGKKLDAWYFILKDGRRVGKEFSLYQDASKTCLLTNRQMKTKMGDANYYGETQREYMRKVNENLYGYSDIDDYKDLLNLLIELRSPKLSKDFKPTKMYDILNKSLSTLNEDDLIDMSKAMDNMDTLKNSLEQQVLVLDSSKNIEKAFNDYNDVVIYNKAKNLMDSKKSKEKCFKESEDLNQNILEHKENRSEVITQIQNNKSILQASKIEQEALAQNDVFKTKSELKAVNDEIIEINKETGKKEENLKKKYSRKLESEKNINEIEYKIEKIKSEISDLMQEESDLSTDIFFDYRWNLVNDIYKDEFNIKLFIDNFEGYSKIVDELYELVFRYNKAKDNKEKNESNFYTKDREYNESARIYNESLEYLTNIKSEYIYNITAYLEKCTELVISEKDKLYIFETVQKIENISATYNLQGILTDIFREKEQVYKNKLENLEREKALILARVKELNKELVELDKLCENFEVDESIENLKKILEQSNIEYIEFYKTIRFIENLDKDTKNGLESVLFNMGYMGSLFIPSIYKAKVEELTRGIDYKIVFKSDDIKDENIEDYFSLEDDEIVKKYASEIRSILKSISFNNLSDIVIEDDYSYKLNSLAMQYKHSYEAKYIGAQERQRYLDKQKEDIRENILSEEEKLAALKNDEDIQSGMLAGFISERDNFESTDDILNSIDIISENLVELNKKEESKNIASEEVFRATREYEEAKTIFYSKKEGISIPADLKIYETVKKSIATYRDVINDIKDSLNEKISDESKVVEQRSNLAYIINEIEDLEFEISMIDDKKRRLESKKSGFETTLSTLNLGDMEEKLDKLTIIISEYPDKIVSLEKNASKLDAKIDYINEGILKLSEEYKVLEKVYTVCLDIFIKEKKLNYISEISSMDDLECAKFILKTFDNNLYLKQNNKLSKLYEVISKNEGNIIDYNLRRDTIFKDFELTNIESVDKILEESSRVDLKIKFESAFVNIQKFNVLLGNRVEGVKLLISEKERETLEDTLIKTLSTKITAKIYNTSKWVKDINRLMGELQTSNGLKLSLVWKAKTAENEDELNSKELTYILSKADFMSDKQREKVVKHFKIKLKNAKRAAMDNGDNKSYQRIIKEVLDYRDWYEFKLEYSMKNQDRKKELTDNGFFRLSGGEKAMSMYVPLFAAVNSRYDRANKECPKIIALDEAFAGIDEENISGIFRLLEGLSLDYVLNSQVLWGTYKTVKNLAIYEIVREGDDIVVPIKYTWNGNIKSMEI